MRRRKEPTFAERVKAREEHEAVQAYFREHPVPKPAGKPTEKIQLPAIIRKRKESA